MKLRVAIIGCGKIADQHLLALRRIPGCAVVAVCDREKLMADQLASRFRIDGAFENSADMLRTVKPDVVHITTPPQSHAALATECLESGSHVYLEKPFTVTASEAETVLELAAQRKRIVTAGHNYQFAPEMVRMRELVAKGFLGGAPVHMESHWSYDLGDLSYVGPLLGSRDHWVRKLPGQLLHNLISHGIARFAEFLDDNVRVTAVAHQSEKLQTLGGAEVMDELRVILRDGRGRTGFFCFSTQLKPSISQFRVYGPRHSLQVDQSSGSLIRLRSGGCKSYLTYVVPSFRQASEYVIAAARNAVHFVTGELHQDFGMKALMQRFYEAIATHGAPPIPYREIVLTVRMMDNVFEEIAAGSPA